MKKTIALLMILGGAVGITALTVNAAPANPSGFALADQNNPADPNAQNPVAGMAQAQDPNDQGAPGDQADNSDYGNNGAMNNSDADSDGGDDGDSN